VAPVLLPLHLAGIASNEAGLLENGAELWVGEDQRARDAVPNGRRLRSYTTPANVDGEIVLPTGIRELEWLMHDHSRSLTPKIVFEGTLVDDQLPGTSRHTDPGNSAFALSGCYVHFSAFRHASFVL
jgi:hypothetical protein